MLTLTTVWVLVYFMCVSLLFQMWQRWQWWRQWWWCVYIEIT